MLVKNDTEVAAIVPVYYTLNLISIDDGMGDDGNRGGLVMGWDGDMGCGWRDGMGSGWWWGGL